jgi:hypothetical protein
MSPLELIFYYLLLSPVAWWWFVWLRLHPYTYAGISGGADDLISFQEKPWDALVAYYRHGFWLTFPGTIGGKKRAFHVKAAAASARHMRSVGNVYKVAISDAKCQARRMRDYDNDFTRHMCVVAWPLTLLPSMVFNIIVIIRIIGAIVLLLIVGALLLKKDMG